MAIDDALYDLMRQTITVEPFSANTSIDGQRSYGSAQTIRARIEAVNTKVFTSSRTDPQAVEVLASRKIYIPDTPVVTVSDRLTLPDGERPRILKVEANPDEFGDTHHQVLWT